MVVLLRVSWFSIVKQLSTNNYKLFVDVRQQIYLGLISTKKKPFHKGFERSVPIMRRSYQTNGICEHFKSCFRLNYLSTYVRRIDRKSISLKTDDTRWYRGGRCETLVTNWAHEYTFMRFCRPLRWSK